MEKMKAPQIGASEAIVQADPAPLMDAFNVSATDFPYDNKKKKEKIKCVPGFIFICNQQSKLDCFQYRVFGLPQSKEKVVNEIKPGAKLFLYDFDVKLLYGIYQATCVGRLNLEPDAFNGKYPAQVKFSIFKECLPLEESSMKNIIRENYMGSKFSQELTLKHVRKLLATFRPLTSLSSGFPSQGHAHVHAPSHPHPHPHGHAHAHPLPLSHPHPHPHLHPHPHVERPNSYIPQMVDPHHPSNLNYFQPGYPRDALYLQHMSPNIGHQSLMTTNSYHSSLQPYNTDSLAAGVQEKAYLSYTTAELSSSHDHAPALESQYHPTPVYQHSTASGYNSKETAPPSQFTATITQQQDQATALESQYIPSSLHNIPYQDSRAAAGYNTNWSAPPAQQAAVTATATTTQQVPTYYYPSTVQSGGQDQYTVPAYAITQAADASHYTANASHYTANASHYTANASHYTVDASQYSGTQPQYQVSAEYYQIPSQDQAVYQENGTTYYYYYYPPAAPADNTTSVSQAP